MKKPVGILRLAFAILSIAAALLQTVALLTSYDAIANYFIRGSILPTLAVVFALLGAVGGTAAAILTDPKELNPTPFAQRLLQAPALLGFLAVAILLPIYGNRAATPRLPIAAAVLLSLAVLYCILSGIPSMREKHSTAIIFLGFATVIGCIVTVACYYFDISIDMNAPVKVATQIGILCSMLYFTCEIRYLLGKTMPRMYLAVSSWVIAIGALCAPAVPVAYFAGKLTRTDYAAGAVLVFCVILTVLLRLKTLLRVPDPEDNNKDEQ